MNRAKILAIMAGVGVTVFIALNSLYVVSEMW
jgi:hypothetical protein